MTERIITSDAGNRTSRRVVSHRPRRRFWISIDIPGVIIAYPTWNESLTVHWEVNIAGKYREIFACSDGPQ